MRLETKKYLYDIKQAADLLLRFARAKTLAGFTADPPLRAADHGPLRGGRLGIAAALLPALTEALESTVEELLEEAPKEAKSKRGPT